jgi:hypothetical protein
MNSPIRARELRINPSAEGTLELRAEKPVGRF